jgi:hypothetical protein
MLEIILLAIIAWLLWLTYITVDGFNEDLKQLRLLVGHIEKYLNKEENEDREHPGDTPFGGAVSINKASKSALMELPKIGGSTAQKIIDNRPYQSLQDLKNISGLSEDVFKQLENKICL